MDDQRWDVEIYLGSGDTIRFTAKNVTVNTIGNEFDNIRYEGKLVLNYLRRSTVLAVTTEPHRDYE
jgi:hypothetical protein